MYVIGSADRQHMELGEEEEIFFSSSAHHNNWSHSIVYPIQWKTYSQNSMGSMELPFLTLLVSNLFSSLRSIAQQSKLLALN